MEANDTVNPGNDPGVFQGSAQGTPQGSPQGWQPSYASTPVSSTPPTAKRGPGRPRLLSDGDVPPTAFASDPVPGTPVATRRGRKGLQYLTPQQLAIVFRSISALSQFTGVQETAFSDQEVQQLAQVWVRVINQYPSVLKYFARAQEATVWGDAIVTTITIMYARTIMVQELKARQNGAVAQNGATSTAETATPDRASAEPASDSDTPGGARFDGGENWFGEIDTGAPFIVNP